MQFNTVTSNTQVTAVRVGAEQDADWFDAAANHDAAYVIDTALNGALGETIRFTSAHNAECAGYYQTADQADPGAVTNAIRMGSTDVVSSSASTVHFRTEEAIQTGLTLAATQALAIIVNAVSYNLFMEPR